MSLAATVRVFGAVVALPLGTWPVRLVVAGVMAGALGSMVPDSPVGLVVIGGELALGLAMGILAGLPIHAARALGYVGTPSAGLLGQIWLWALFFTAGGAGLWLTGLAESLSVIPAGRWPGVESLATTGGAFFYAALLLSLPVFFADLAAAPLAGWLDRVGRPGVGDGTLVALRPALGILAFVLLLPTLLDAVRETWWRVLSGG